MNQSRWKKRFFSIWGGQALSLVGSEIVQFSLIWWLTESTGSATALATASLMSLVPRIGLGPIAGALVDRWDRRRIMILADASVALFTVALFLLFLAEQAQTWHVQAILLLRTVGGLFHRPAMMASTPLLVPKEQLPRVAGMNQTVRGLIDIGSPLLGAVLLSLLPLQGILVIDIVTAIVAIAPLLLFIIPQPIPDPSRRRLRTVRTVVDDLKQGFRFILRWPGLLINVATYALVVFVAQPTVALGSLMIREHFQGGPAELGLFSSAYGVGIVLGGLILGLWGGFKRRMTTVLVGTCGVGLMNVVRGLAPPDAFWLFATGTLLGGVFSSLESPITAIFQATVPPHIQGRVFGLIDSIISVIAPLSLAVSGPLADSWGVRPFYLLRGVVTLLVAIATWAIPGVRNLEDGPPESANEVARAI